MGKKEGGGAYHAVRQTVEELFEEAGYEGLVGGELVLAAREEDGERQQAVLDTRERCRGFPLLCVQVDREEASHAAEKLDVGLRLVVAVRGCFATRHARDEPLQGRQGLGHNYNLA